MVDTHSQAPADSGQQPGLERARRRRAIAPVAPQAKVNQKTSA